MENIFVDYHLHSSYSPDCSLPIESVIRTAKNKGLQEICITDHVEVDNTYGDRWLTTPRDIKAQLDAVTAAWKKTDAFVKRGLELGLADNDPGTTEDLCSLFDPNNYDFIIASLHQVDSSSPFSDEFFKNRTLSEAAFHYVDCLNTRLREMPLSHFDAVGHIDFVSKGVHGLKDPSLHLTDFYEPATDLFRYLIDNGKTIEINTSSYKALPNAGIQGLDWLKHFVKLGGEFVTIGSDAHREEYIAYRLDDAIELARAAGIKYIATYNQHEATMHKLS